MILLERCYFTHGLVSGTWHSREMIINMKSKLYIKEQPFDSMRIECTITLRSPEQHLCSCPFLALPLLQPAEHCLVLRFAPQCWALALLSRTSAEGCCGCLCPPYLTFLSGEAEPWGQQERGCVPEAQPRPSGRSSAASPLGFSGCPGASPTHTGLQLVLVSCSAAA